MEAAGSLQVAGDLAVTCDPSEPRVGVAGTLVACPCRVAPMPARASTVDSARSLAARS